MKIIQFSFENRWGKCEKKKKKKTKKKKKLWWEK
jgi:hypothetical protein